MFIINITYKTELEKVNQFLNEHIKFLDEQYKLGNFLASGRKVPRTGGIILSKINNKTTLERIIKKDPFNINKLANYELIEFIPSKTCNELKFLIEE
ncbi:YciI family protein [Tenacibaculum ovolyticum]|uniref:YciI family protein n=1 Tax=Tenacibaculum ovolyticum TaxID=104270 RepID=UPI0007ECDE47|nr:YciI family protein [Tenacibaculum ovolyticum]